MVIEKLFFALLRCSITGEEIPSELRARLDLPCIKAVLSLARKHDLSHLVAKALIDNDCASDEQTKEDFLSYQMSALIRREQANYDFKTLKDFFEKEHITYIPLKGAVICQYYPEAWMRTSCDIDILVREEAVEHIAGLMVEHLAYSRKTTTYHDISLQSPYGTHVELHFHIKENEDGIDRLLSKAWDHAKPLGATVTEWCFTNEYFLFHLYAHMAYHFLHGGCGVRPFLDLWILRTKMSYSEEKLVSMCQETDIHCFYQSVNAALDVWFNRKEETELVAAMREYVLNGGVYGTVENRIAVQRSKLGTKSFIWSRLWLSREELRTSYPVLDKHPFLLPLCQIGRWYHALISGRAKRSKTEMRVNQSLSEECVHNTAKLLQSLGLS